MLNQQFPTALHIDDITRLLFIVNEDYVKPEGDQRTLTVYGNMGSGSLFSKNDSRNSRSEIRVVGDNLNGELGTGNDGLATRATTITLPGTVTYVARAMVTQLCAWQMVSLWLWR